MIRPRDLAALVALLVAACPAGAVIVLTGEVRSVDAQPIYTPRSNMSPVVIRYFVPEGQAVKKGDVVLRIDPGQAASQVQTLQAQIEQARAKADKELADLEVKALEAELAQAKADAKLADARVEAAIPAELISGLDHDRYQGELERAGEEATLKRHDALAAREAVKRRRTDAELEVHKLQVDLDYNIWSAGNAEVRAQRDGVVIHGFNNNWLGGRIDEGSSAMTGSEAGQVVSGGAMQVRAWVLEADRPGLHAGETVWLDFDALPGQRIGGHITTIAGAPTTRSEWGRGRYFQVDIEMDSATHSKGLLPGMSVRVTPRPTAEQRK